MSAPGAATRASAALAGLLTLCGGAWLHASAAAPERPARERPDAAVARAGGDTTVDRIDTDAFSLPSPNLSLARRRSFFAGNAFFTQPWVQAPSSTTARDGLGPLFNTNTCQSCHLKDGRGRPPEAGETMISMLVRVGLPADGEPTGAGASAPPDPTYGDQIQTQGLLGVPGEAKPRLEWARSSGQLADGSGFELVRPSVKLDGLAYGPLHEAAGLSLRVAPALVGMGLLEAVPEASIARREDPEDADGDGISGRARRVWDRAAGRARLGRFGWKAAQPSVRQQVAAAFASDLGVTSSLFPDEPCSPRQPQCREQPTGGRPELSDPILELVTFYVQTLGVPARRGPQAATVRSGESLFRRVGCHACHVETHVTGALPDLPELSGQRIHPYTDLLLHDMGPGLADGLAEPGAERGEWRTPPLWGIGLVEIVSRHTRFLHDGRARSLEEAILWHGGEARAARDAYAELSRIERDHLIQFLRSL